MQGLDEVRLDLKQWGSFGNEIPLRRTIMVSHEVHAIARTRQLVFMLRQKEGSVYWQHMGLIIECQLMGGVRLYARHCVL